MTAVKVELKSCSACGVDKVLEAFAVDRTRADGRAHRCRECQAVYFRAYYARRKGEICKRTAAAYQKANPDVQRKAKRNWQDGAWHIDHKVPVARLIRRGVKDPAKINCLANLAPLWAEENLAKSKR